MTTDESQEVLATAAVHLDQARGLLSQVSDGGERGWPEGMANGEVAPSLEFRIHTDVRMLLEDFVAPGLSLALDASRLSEAQVEREWQADRQAAARFDEEMSVQLSVQLLPAANDDDYLPHFLAEVRKVMVVAHGLRGKTSLTDAERVTRSKAVRLQAALRGEESLESYVAHVLSRRRPPALDDLKDGLRTPVREALFSLSQSALGLSAMLRRASDLGFDVGIDPETMTSITEVIEELARRVAALEAREDE